jgi:hypothetical protein
MKCLPEQKPAAVSVGLASARGTEREMACSSVQNPCSHVKPDDVLPGPDVIAQFLTER